MKRLIYFQRCFFKDYYVTDNPEVKKQRINITTHENYYCMPPIRSAVLFSST